MKFLFLVLSLFISVLVSAQVINDTIVSVAFNKQVVYGFKIKTNIPFTSNSAMPTISIDGYDYTSGSPIGLTLVSYIQGDIIKRNAVSTHGAFNPPIRMANENGKISIFIDYLGYYTRFVVSAFAKSLSAETAANFTGWTVVDSPLIATATQIADMPYKNSFAGTVYLPDSVTVTSDGKLGVGTLTPRASLDVATAMADTTTSILGRLSNGNTTGDGTYLGVRAYNANANNIPMFGLLSKYGGVTNCGIIFNKGTGTGGYLTFLTNDGTEKMRLDKNGNLAIGTTNPGTYKLAVEGTVGARKLEIKLDSWADYVFQPNYQLPGLNEVRKFINQHHHLPAIPSEQEVKEKGIDVGEMNKLLLQKIEELTLYLIEQQERIEVLEHQTRK